MAHANSNSEIGNVEIEIAEDRVLVETDDQVLVEEPFAEDVGDTRAFASLLGMNAIAQIPLVDDSSIDTPKMVSIASKEHVLLVWEEFPESSGVYQILRDGEQVAEVYENYWMDESPRSGKWHDYQVVGDGVFEEFEIDPEAGTEAVEVDKGNPRNPGQYEPERVSVPTQVETDYKSENGL